jgi:hypothetical protein
LTKLLLVTTPLDSNEIIMVNVNITSREIDCPSHL